MSLGFSIEQFQNQMNQLTSLGIDTSLFQNSEIAGNEKFVNSVFTLAGEAQAAKEGNDTEKANAIKNMIENILSMIAGINNETSKATSEIKKKDGDASQTAKEGEATAKDIKTEVAQIMKDVLNDTTTISQAMNRIKELGGEDGQGGEIAKAQEELDKQIEIIETNKQIVNDGVSNIDAKKEALENIRAAASVINGLVETVLNMQEQIEAQNAIVEGSAENIEKLVQNAASSIEGGAAKLQALMGKGAVQIADNTATDIEGSADETVGTSLTTSGAATTWVPVIGQTASSKAISTGIDLTTAGGIRIAGASKNIGSLGTAIGSMSSNLGDFADIMNNVGDLANSASDLIGQYGAMLTPLITATGSWSNVAEVNAQLEEAVAEASEKLEGNKTSNQTFGNFMNTNQTQNFFGNTKTNSSKQSDNNQTANGENVILDFDTKLYKKSFGI